MAVDDLLSSLIWNHLRVGKLVDFVQAAQSLAACHTAGALPAAAAKGAGVKSKTSKTYENMCCADPPKSNKFS